MFCRATVLLIYELIYSEIVMKQSSNGQRLDAAGISIEIIKV